MVSVVSPTDRLSIEVHLDAAELVASMRADVLVGLVGSEKELSPTWFYDPRGCDLFELITELPEYYQTRAEHEILCRRGCDIAAWSGADTFVELGSGTSEKTRVLLAALEARGMLRDYVAFDIAEPTLRQAAVAIVEAYPALNVTGVVGDFRRQIDVLPTGGRRLIAMLGGTIGNLRPPERSVLLASLARTMNPGDSLLLGVDLVKDVDRLVAAYDDAEGVTAEFNLNVLTRMNRELGADFRRQNFCHVARFDESQEWIEMRLRSNVDQRVKLVLLNMEVELARGEEIRTEISAKFRRANLEAELTHAGLQPAAWWTDAAGDYAVSLTMK